MRLAQGGPAFSTYNRLEHDGKRSYLNGGWRENLCSYDSSNVEQNFSSVERGKGIDHDFSRREIYESRCSVAYR